MVFLYSGTPGSGKSLHQASNLLYGLKATDSLFVCNYEINLDVVGRHRGEYIYLPNDELKPSRLIQISREYFSRHRFKEGKINLYIDEAQLIFNAREWDMQGRREWISFFTQHRKYGYDVILISQFDRMLDRQIRSLIEYEVVHRKLSNFGLKGKLLSLAMGGNMFVSVKIWYPMKEKTDSTFFRYNAKLGKLYDTYKHFDGESADPATAAAASEGSSAAPGASDPGAARSDAPGCDSASDPFPMTSASGSGSDCIDDREILSHLRGLTYKESKQLKRLKAIQENEISDKDGSI